MTRCRPSLARTSAAVLAGALLVGLLSGCAQQGSLGGAPTPDAIIEIMVRMAGPVDENAYYFVAFDVDDDQGDTFPVPVAAGPFWGNGWGTGSITYFLEYHLGQYNLFRTQLNSVLESHSGGLVDIAGTAAGTAAGVYDLTVQTITLGAATLGGTGRITGVTNLSSQNAGVLELETEAAGEVVAGSVTWTPALDGGRVLTTTEQAAVDALNAGGVVLASDSLAALGLELAIAASGSGVQTITVAPAVADIEARFTSASTGQATTYTGTVTANSTTSTTTPPVPGLTIITEDLTTGDTAKISVELSPDPATLVTPDWFVATPPAGGNTLRASFDLAGLGQNLTNISFNFITVRQPLFDPTVIDPDDHVYDGLGPLGNDAVREFDPRQFLSLTNADSFIPEGAGDSTLEGPATEQEKNTVDIVDWSLAVRRL